MSVSKSVPVQCSVRELRACSVRWVFHKSATWCARMPIASELTSAIPFSTRRCTQYHHQFSLIAPQNGPHIDNQVGVIISEFCYFRRRTSVGERSKNDRQLIGINVPNRFNCCARLLLSTCDPLLKVMNTFSSTQWKIYWSVVVHPLIRFINWMSIDTAWLVPTTQQTSKA